MSSLSGRLVMLSPPGAGELICPLELCTSLGDTLTPAADVVCPHRVPRTRDSAQGRDASLDATQPSVMGMR